MSVFKVLQKCFAYYVIHLKQQNNSIANRPKQNSILKEVVFAGSNFHEFHKFGGISPNLISANFLAKRNL